MNGNKNFFINGASEIVPPVNDSPYKRILGLATCTAPSAS